jgi:hypothetical protein
MYALCPINYNWKRCIIMASILILKIHEMLGSGEEP